MAELCDKPNSLFEVLVFSAFAEWEWIENKSDAIKWENGTYVRIMYCVEYYNFRQNRYSREKKRRKSPKSQFRIKPVCGKKIALNHEYFSNIFVADMSGYVVEHAVRKIEFH